MTTFEQGSKRNCLVTYKVDKAPFLQMVADHLAKLS